MTDLHPKFPCVKCGRKLRHLHGPEKNICTNCNKKIRMPIGPKIFNENLKKPISIITMLTPTQHDLLQRRLKQIFPKIESKYRTGITKYVRKLILNDLREWSEKNEIL